MSPIVTLLLAGAVVSTAIKVAILVVGVKAYRAKHQGAPDSMKPMTLGKRLARDTSPLLSVVRER